MPSAAARRLVLLTAAGLLLAAVCVVPPAILAVALVRTVLVPPVAGARLAEFDGVQVGGNCTNSPSSRGGQVVLCSGFVHMDSRFEIVDHSSAAVAWCIQRVDENHFNLSPPRQFGPLLVGNYPPVPADWGDCEQSLPMRVGLFAEIFIHR